MIMFYYCQNTDNTIIVTDETITAVNETMVYKLYLIIHNITSEQKVKYPF